MPFFERMPPNKHVPLTHTDASELEYKRIADLRGEWLSLNSIQFNPKNGSSVSPSASDASRPKQIRLKTCFFELKSLVFFLKVEINILVDQK